MTPIVALVTFAPVVEGREEQHTALWRIPAFPWNLELTSAAWHCLLATPGDPLCAVQEWPWASSVPLSPGKFGVAQGWKHRQLEQSFACSCNPTAALLFQQQL